MKQQVLKTHYNFDKYCDQERFVSYWHQLKEVLGVKSGSVLEVGVGDQVMANYIKQNTDVKYTSIDIAKDLKPDVVGDVASLPFENNSFDVVCAFEVLEHLEFDKFVIALKEMKRVADKYVIISLPHWGRHFSLKTRLPFLKQIKFQFKLSLFPIKHVFKGEHYWEIGKKGYGLKRIKKEIESSGLKIMNDYIVFDSPYHHFFVTKK